MSAATIARGCRVYVFEVWDPHTGYSTKTVGYVGETGRLPFERLMEHVYSQPWADTIVGWYVLDEVYPEKAAVLAAEDATIKRLRPLYNYEGNLDNPRRVPIPEARRQRERRDAERGVVPWQPPTPAQPRPARRPTSQPTTSRRPRRRGQRRRTVVTMTVAWLAVTSLFWLLPYIIGLPLHGLLRLEDAAIASTVAFAAVWASTFPRRALRRKALNAAAVALLGLGVWLTVAPTLTHPTPLPTLHQESHR